MHVKPSKRQTIVAVIGLILCVICSIGAGMFPEYMGDTISVSSQNESSAQSKNSRTENEENTVSSSPESVSSETVSSEEGDSEATSSEPESSEEESSGPESSAEESSSQSEASSRPAVSSKPDVSSRPESSKPISPYPYYIKVNKQMNCVTVYAKDEDGEFTKPVKAMVCSVGNSTPLGTFTTSSKYTWRILFGNVYGQYATRITGHILFHSVPYYKADKSTLETEEYNKLGTTASAGCIRLSVADAKWIVDNCPSGTTVTIYNDANPGPLGKPTPIRIPSDCTWDPTDPDPANPWKNMGEDMDKDAEILGVCDQMIEAGSAFDPMNGVAAKDGSGEDLTENITVSGEVNITRAGTYTLQYSVTGRSGKKITASAKITVQDTAPPVIQANRAYIGENDIVNDIYALSWADAADAAGIQSFTAAVTEESPWVFRVVYSAQDINGLTSQQEVVFEREHYGQLQGVCDRAVSSEEEVLSVSHIAAFDKDVPVSVLAEIISQNENVYLVRYTAQGTARTAEALITLQ